MDLKRNYTAHVLGASSLNAGIGGQDEAIVSAAQFSLLKKHGLRENDSVLELGCGTGRLLISLSGYLNNHGRYMGIDLVDNLVDFTRNRILNLGLNGNTFRTRKMIDERDLPKEQFDFICAFSVYTHMDPEDIYKSMKALLGCARKETRLFVTFLGLETIFGKHYFLKEAEMTIADRYTRVRNVAMVESQAVLLSNLAGWSVEDMYWSELDQPFEQGQPVTNQTYLLLKPT